MKAIIVSQFGGPDVLQLGERARPEAGSGEVLVRLDAVGINPVETYIRSGTYNVKPSLPYTPGTDGAGVIEAVGKKIDRFKKGDRVYTSGSLTGTYAEFALCVEADVHPLPAGLSFAQGAGLGVPYGAAYRALIQRGGAKAGETVLVHGASGSVGTAALQIARFHGLRVLGTAGSEKGLARVAEEGAEAFNHHTEEYLERIRKAAGEQGINLILEMLANVNLEKDLELIADHGRIVVIGTRGTIEIDPRRALMRESDIRGMSLPHASSVEKKSLYAGIDAGLASGVLRPVVGRSFRLSEAAEAHRTVIEGGSGGKIVLTP